MMTRRSRSDRHSQSWVSMSRLTPSKPFVTSAKVMRVLLDTSVFVAAVTRDTDRSDEAIELLDQIDDPLVSVLSLMELRSVLSKKKRFERDRIDAIENRVTHVLKRSIRNAGSDNPDQVVRILVQRQSRRHSTNQASYYVYSEQIGFHVNHGSTRTHATDRRCHRSDCPVSRDAPRAADDGDGRLGPYGRLERHWRDVVVVATHVGSLPVNRSRGEDICWSGRVVRRMGTERTKHSRNFDSRTLAAISPRRSSSSEANASDEMSR